ncbi:MAG: hypothetical protein LBO72_04595, partial [Helicobacteraceae bacterium]|nr:hypothetical protein [Helicobacteraceae bacterium]
MSVKNKTRDSATKAQNDKRDAQNDKRDAPKLPVEKRLSVFGELSALHKSILRSLLISKAARKQSAETLTDRFAADISAKAKERLERFLGDLIQTIMSAAEQTDSADVLTIGEAIADGFSYNLASIALFDLYRRARDESKQNEVKKADYGASGASFGARDAANLAALERQFFWLKTSADERTREKIKEVLRSVFEPRDGQPPLAYNEIGAALRAKFGELANAEPSRLQSAGFTLARQNVNIAHAAQMIDDDVPFARVHADMDAKTTPICRSLHGRLIPMAHIKAQLDKITAANSIGATIAARDMSKTAPIYGELPANIGIPPYHFNCRTTILAHYGATSFEALSGARSPLEVLSEYR